jgi:hypothetical protein
MHAAEKDQGSSIIGDNFTAYVDVSNGVERVRITPI